MTNHGDVLSAGHAGIDPDSGVVAARYLHESRWDMPELLAGPTARDLAVAPDGEAMLEIVDANGALWVVLFE